ncbi:slipin family protein [Pelagicoccus sp. SDUM812002]|uniref:slipin family protein n=1 Tax=Pelagicoccus sp. SDUM812002 TaxID=3041266 RepID=UPI00280C6951|nr:slipin family protein [Pelagicoccus sp. SDUM812002]MDQ8186961.1 slipin family protein [Pelagicoccus sp. SDUM812002]
MRNIRSNESGIRTDGGLSIVSLTVGVILIGTPLVLLNMELIPPFVAAIASVIGLFIAYSIRIANQWEKAVVLRMGKFVGLKGPGVFFVIPIIERVDLFIDQRVRVTDFHAEKTLTKDTVPVNVDAVVYWMVWDVEKAALEVEKYYEAVAFIAQTGLRDIIGRHELAELLQHREKVGEALQKTLDEHTNPWGITCQTVGIKDIIIPEALADAMSKQAQAERERQARIILGTAETEIAEKFAKASDQYRNNPTALQLRGMNMLFEGLKEKGSLIIVPSSALDSMNLGAIGGLSALAEQQKNEELRGQKGHT